MPCRGVRNQTSGGAPQSPEPEESRVQGIEGTNAIHINNPNIQKATGSTRCLAITSYELDRMESQYVLEATVQVRTAK